MVNLQAILISSANLPSLGTQGKIIKNIPTAAEKGSWESPQNCKDGIFSIRYSDE
ncbi:hypothetical protein H6G80_13610 [Nostoc sp. FACHB-87]|uniref:hypothetical protein n=1 Tax=Nostocales TaxID=1161 RepID=UPI001688B256|nr:MULTISPECIES: hypothetical protein [Nostocales]MBD2300868.1 hypothetical protein [Nostoc sp. FACHB-190]MBD2455119.1 hypothetical protein [Nostoc sp. FACHB-87]MBD2477873.1 hypothetical protein [Anabaena sp. FACHB-83]MBD2487286.1 hypothetical protein [Aulosira sp. FACHB-615]